MKIYAVKAPTCYYITANPVQSYRNESGLEGYLFDGRPADKSFHGSWLVIPKEPAVVSHMKRQPNINYRYHLIDESLASEKFPLELMRDDVTYADGGDHYFKAEYAQLQSLYQLLSDKQPDLEIIDEFEFIVCLEVESVTAPSKMEYRVQRTHWSHEGVCDLDNGAVKHQLIDLIMFPSLLIHETPCRYTSEDSFKIVRQHIKDNIDPKVAKITSDYNFCFEVQKRIPMAKAYKYTVDVNNDIFSKRKRRPKYETRTKEERLEPVFEMTWSPENYKGYTPIRDFEGRNEDDLKEQIDAYLEHIMAVINEPMRECDKCCGVGFLKGGK